MIVSIRLVLGFLAVARVTQFLVNDRLSLSWRRWAITKFGENGLMAYLVHCSWCTSIYVATLVMPLVLLLPFQWALIPAAILAASYVTGYMDKG